METTSAILGITQRAAEKARTLAEREGTPDASLRVRVVAGGCSGFSYQLGFEAMPADGDLLIEAHGLRVLVDTKSAPLLEGSTLVFDDALLGGGFKIENPRAVHECACGESFSV